MQAKTRIQVKTPTLQGFPQAMLISSLQRRLEEDSRGSALKFRALLPNYFKLVLASEWWVNSWGERQSSSAYLMSPYLLVLEHRSSTQLKDYISQAPVPGMATGDAHRYQSGNGDRGLPERLFKWSRLPYEVPPLLFPSSPFPGPQEWTTLMGGRP